MHLIILLQFFNYLIYSPVTKIVSSPMCWSAITTPDISPCIFMELDLSLIDELTLLMKFMHIE